ncbi:MAG: hypothetical protein MK202_13715 [Tenacibaculum sp.]|nr:hypothetical protein [Tenacibaculum sp.]
MKKKENNVNWKTISFITLTLSALLFVWKSNDHNECESEEIVEIKKDGSQIKTTKHICKEKYNF